MDDGRIKQTAFVQIKPGDKVERIYKDLRELERRGIKSPTGKDKWNKSTIEKMLVNRKYTGDVAIAGSDNIGNRYMIKEQHYGIISKEMFEAVELEMACRSNVEETENGVKRKSTKYSSKRKKETVTDYAY